MEFGSQGQPGDRETGQDAEASPASETLRTDRKQFRRAGGRVFQSRCLWLKAHFQAAFPSVSEVKNLSVMQETGV